jgi:catechol 2,3-dioxygenase-like lactoylglutathione lyase family enzyme
MQYTFHHVAFTVKDINESSAWYADVLGFKEVFRYEKPHVKIVNLEYNGFVLELLEFGKDTKPLPDYRKNLQEELHVVGTKHLCIESEDLDLTIQMLKEKQVEFEGEVDTAAAGGKFIFFRDCNGILLELYER